MYYHIRLDKILHDGRTDLPARVHWDFRSLTKALAMISRDFGSNALCWRIQDLTERTPDIMQLEDGLRVALESMYQFVVMTFKDGFPAQEKYDHFEFFVVIRDETQYPPEFSYSEEKEAEIQPGTLDAGPFVDLYFHPINANQIASFRPVCDNGQDVFSGMVIKLKNGNRFFLIAGQNQRREPFNLGVNGIDKTMIAKILPSTPNGVDLHGFIVRLTSGDSLYLTIARLLPSDQPAQSNL